MAGADALDHRTEDQRVRIRDGAGDRLVRRTDPCGASAGDERRHDGGGAGCRMDGARSRQERPPACCGGSSSPVSASTSPTSSLPPPPMRAGSRTSSSRKTCLSWEIRQQLARNAPAALTVPSGRAMTIDYADDGSVSVSVKLQELFGLAETPRIGPIEDADHVSSACAEWTAGADDAGPQEFLGAHLSGSAQGVARPLSETSRGRKIRGGPRRRTVRSRVRRERRVAARAVTTRIGTARRNAAGAGS